MLFAEKYARSVNSSDLHDDDRHHSTDALHASGLADMHAADASMGNIGALLNRVKYADGVARKEFEGNPANLARLIRIWGMLVAQKGQERAWIKPTNSWDIQTAPAFFNRVAKASIIYWLDGKCTTCKGASILLSQHTCPDCKGSGQSEIKCSSEYEKSKVIDMVSELEEIAGSHSMRASWLLRRG